MDQFPLGFTKCPKCQEYSIYMESSLGSPFGPSFQDKSNGRIIEWECPYCFVIISEEELKKNMVRELDEEIEYEKRGFKKGQILEHMPEEISAQEARKMATEYMKSLNIKEFPPSFEKVRVSDCQEEWWVDFDKITKKNAKVFPPNYCVILNKKTGGVNLVSLNK
ncbi:MAG: hypothetical protein V1756_00955 [Patescibacteria group bacterium]